VASNNVNNAKRMNFLLFSRLSAHLATMSDRKKMLNHSHKSCLTRADVFENKWGGVCTASVGVNQSNLVESP
jgi:hypothetical protein